MKKAETNTYLFEEMKISRAVLSLVIPTVISQIINVVYNIADTYFVARIGDPDQVAAVSVCMPLFIFLTGLANLFGIGGASLISRLLGAGERDKASKVSSFCVWTAGSVALTYALVMGFASKSILPLIGANDATLAFCGSYMFYTICLGAVPTVLNLLMAHLVRSEGYSAQASFGMILGGGLNIILDPVLITALDMQIRGAALATLVSNTVSLVYFAVLLYTKRGATVINADPKRYSASDRIPSEVLLVGLPSAMMNITGVASNIVFNRLMSSYCNEAIAGLGIAKKVDLFGFALATGMTQGVLPLLGYTYSAGMKERMRSAFLTALGYSLAAALTIAVILYTGSDIIVNAFIKDPLTVYYASMFQKLICIGGPCISVSMMIITTFQATGVKHTPFVLSLLRKGVLDIPLLFLLDRFFGVEKALWATPLAEALAMTAALIAFIPLRKKMNS